MAYRLLLDENVEYEVLHRLENYGHDVEHVDFVRGLGKGTDDDSIARYSSDEERVVVTYDDDFVLEVDEDDYRAVLYVGDATLSVEQVADVVHAVSRHYPLEELHGLTYVGENWLRAFVHDARYENVSARLSVPRYGGSTRTARDRHHHTPPNTSVDPTLNDQCDAGTVMTLRTETAEPDPIEPGERRDAR